MYTTKVINTSNSLRITACILLSHSSLITDKLANGIYASLPFYGSWENHFSKVNRRGGENSKWSFKGAHYTDFDSITYYSQALEKWLDGVYVIFSLLLMNSYL